MGNFNFTGGQTFLLASSLGSTDNTILLESFAEPVTGTKYTMSYLDTDIVYATIAPKTASTEFISFTGITQNNDGTALLTGVTRGLSRSYPYTTSTSYKLPHSGQTQLILSNSPQFYEEFVTKRNAETISGVKTFSVSPIVPDGASGAEAINYEQAAALIAGGVADASTTIAGKVLKPSQAEVDAGSATGNDGGAISRTLMVTPDTLRARMYNDYVADTGTTDTYVITPSPAIAAYATGQIFTFIAAHASDGGACTLAVNGLAATPIKKNYNVALAANDILAGQVIIVEYDGTNFQMLNPYGNQQEIIANKDTTTTLGTSDTKYPSQKAVKTYVDNSLTNVYLGTQTLSNGANTITAGYQSAWKYVIIVLSTSGSGGGGGITLTSEVFVYKTGKTTASASGAYSGGTSFSVYASVSGTTITISQSGTTPTCAAYYYQ